MWTIGYCLVNCFKAQMISNYGSRMLTYWYSNQRVHIRWGSTVSRDFHVLTGVRQGGILSPYLFRFYIRDVIHVITSMRVGCNVGGQMINLLCFADGMVLLSPSWVVGLQLLIDKLHALAIGINMSFSVSKTVCMVFNPLMSSKIVSKNFPAFTVDMKVLKFVREFKYLGTVIADTLRDDCDIEREIRCLFVRCNILISRFRYCSWHAKIRLFRTYCFCF